MEDLLLLNTVSQKDENPIPQGWMISQHHTLKSKLPKYRLKKAQYRNTINPDVQLLIELWVSLHLPI